MKKLLIITFAGLAAITVARAQDYKINKTSGKLDIRLSGVTVEGYDGNQVVFHSERDEQEKDPRAKGLRAINGNGLEDNTGLGINVVENGATTEVRQVASSNQDIKIMVPKGVIVSFSCRSVEAGTVRFKNLDNEIEISTEYNSVELENVTGPATVKALYGGVTAKFNDHIKGPISIVSVYAAVDITIPGDTKANVNLSSSHGEILAAAGLKIEMAKHDEGGMVRYGGANDVEGKLNGGGIELKLSSEYGKIYLRETK